MISSFAKSLLAIAALATLATAGAVAPAAAQGWGGRDHRWEDRRGWDHGRGGWDRGRGGWDRDRGEWGRRPHWYRERCWVEVRPVRVHTPWGPRFRNVEQRVCR